MSNPRCRGYPHNGFETVPSASVRRSWKPPHAEERARFADSRDVTRTDVVQRQRRQARWRVVRTVVLEEVAADEAVGSVREAECRTSLALAYDFVGIPDGEGRLVAMSYRAQDSCAHDVVVAVAFRLSGG